MAASTDAPAMFTRGGLDAPDMRGGSMVEKHREKLQKEKEEAALQAVRAAVPELGPTVCVLALEGAGWEVDAALGLLKGFEADYAPQLAELQQKRKELEPVASPAVSESNSDDSSDGDHERRKRRRSKHSIKGKASKKDSKRRGKDSKRSASRKDSKRAKKEGGGIEGVVKEGFGAHGILRETDMYDKRSEFQRWAIDIKKVDIEIMPKPEEKELFRDFMEDYNTSTLPHEKYYNLEAYESKKAARAAKKGTDPKDEEKTAFDDEAERRRELAEERREAQAERLRDTYNQLKYTAVGKAEDMREQEMMKMRMQQAYRVGDHELAEKLKSKLAPDDPVKEAQRKANESKGPNF